MLCIALYAPSSPQRLVDCAKVVFDSGIVDLLAIVKPVGMAAQVGLAEVSKLAYKKEKNMVVLSQLGELREVLGVEELLVLVHDSDARPITEVVKELGPGKRICVVIQGSETSIPKSELVSAIPVRHAMPEMDVNPVADTAMVIYELRSLVPRT